MAPTPFVLRAQQEHLISHVRYGTQEEQGQQ